MPNRKMEQTTITGGLYIVDNLTPDLVKMRKEGNYIVLDYGTIKFNSDSRIKLKITAPGARNPKVSSSCGCTVLTIKKVGDVLPMEITYDTKRLDEIYKTVKLTYNRKIGPPVSITFLITGNVVK